MMSFLGGLVGGLFKAAVDWWSRRQQRADQIELGEQKQAVAQRQAAEEATTRMHKAQAGPRGPKETGRALDDGSF
jgi:hypothetical protein